MVKENLLVAFYRKNSISDRSLYPQVELAKTLTELATIRKK